MFLIPVYVGFIMGFGYDTVGGGPSLYGEKIFYIDIYFRF